MNAPILFNYDNLAEGVMNPSSIVTNTETIRYYAKYLLEKFLGELKITIPKEWAENYFENVLFRTGKIAIFDTPRYGVICQQCGLRGFDIFYQPTHAVIANPYIEGITKDLRIGDECEIIRLQDDYSGVMDIVYTYASKMALLSEAIDNNIFAVKVATVFACKDDKQAVSFRKMYEKISAGMPAVFVDKSLFDDDGNPQWQQFQADLSKQYLVDKYIENMKSIEAMYDAEIGLNNVNYEKKERLIVDEINANNQSTESKLDKWIETMQACCEKVNDKYGIGINIERRHPAMTEREETNYVESIEQSN